MKLPIPDDWDNQTWCRYAVCWPQSEKWLAVLRGFITLPQRGRTWDERTGSILDVQAIGREITSSTLPEREVIMACGDEGLADIAISIQALASATNNLANRQCCSDLQIDINGGVQGSITQASGEVIPIYGSQPPGGLEPGDFPPEYENESAYLVDKCRKAHMIIDGLIETLENIAAFGTFNAISLAILIAGAIAFGIIFPPSAIPAAITIVMILSGSLVLIAQLVSVLRENKEELICILYESDNAIEIISAIADFLDVAIAGITTVGKFAWALKALALWIINSDTLNQLFTGTPAQGYPDADCSECVASWWSCLVGTEVSHTANTVEAEAVQVQDGMYLAALAYSDEEPLVNLSAEATGWTSPSDEPNFASAWDIIEDRCGQGSGFPWLNKAAGFQSGPVEARVLQIRSQTPFTITWTRE